MLNKLSATGAIALGREIRGDLESAQQREWLVINGIRDYASGTIAGLAHTGHHGLLIAALKPPTERTLLITKLDELGVDLARLSPGARSLGKGLNLLTKLSAFLFLAISKICHK